LEGQMKRGSLKTWPYGAPIDNTIYILGCHVCMLSIGCFLYIGMPA